MRIISFDFIKKGDLTSCGLVDSAHYPLYWYIYWRVHFYMWVVWGLLKNFHAILLVLVKSVQPEFFWKALFLQSTYKRKKEKKKRGCK